MKSPALCSQVAFPQSMQSLGVMHYGILPEGASQNARASRILGPHMRDGHGVGWNSMIRTSGWPCWPRCHQSYGQWVVWVVWGINPPKKNNLGVSSCKPWLYMALPRLRFISLSIAISTSLSWFIWWPPFFAENRTSMIDDENSTIRHSGQGSIRS